MGFRTNQDSADWDRPLLQSPSPEVATPQQPETLKCPRCGSPNTKFCYYNNYNKSQPRHFCKSCKRHWTKGGTLRNVPVGGCRKNKRPKVSTAAAKSGAGAPNLCPSFANSSGDRKGGGGGVPNIFYQALIRSSNPSLNESMDGINISAAVPGKNLTSSDETKTKTTDSTGMIMNPAAPNSEFQFSNLGSGFEMNNPLIQSSYQPINSYEMGNMDSMEESTVTMDYPSMSGGGAWLGLESGNCSSMELANYWNWSELDALTSPDDLNISWDEEEEKVKP